MVDRPNLRVSTRRTQGSPSVTQMGCPLSVSHVSPDEPLPADLVRPRLTSAVLSTGPGGLCLITAPQGYGATTAVARALAGEPLVVWCPRERFDPEPLSAVLARAVGGPPPDGTGWVVIDGLTRDTVDEYGWDAVHSMAQRLPASWRLVVIAACAVPANVLALAARPGSQLLTGDELMFTEDEAMALLQRAAPGIDIDTARTITEAAEGCAVALAAAAAHAKRGRPDPHWLTTTGPAALFDDQLQRLPQPLPEFLLQTAELELLNGDLASAVCGRADAGALLGQLADWQMYLRECSAPAGQPGRWWHRHGLLSAALRERAGDTRVEQHSRAADWFAATGDVTSTMHHLLAAGRGAEAKRYLTDHGSTLMSEGRAAEVAGWYRRLPRQWSGGADQLIGQAWAEALSGDITAADITAARLDVALGQEEQPAEANTALTLTGERDLLQAYLAGFHADPATMIAASRRAQDALLPQQNRPGSQLAPLLTINGLLWSGRLTTALATSEGAMARTFSCEILRECHRPAQRSLVLCAAGRIREAAVEAQRSMAWLDHAKLDPLDVQFLPAAAALARVKLESAEVAEGHDLGERLEAAADRHGHRGQQVEALVMLAAAAAARDQLAEAVALLTRAQEIALAACPGSQLTALIDEQLVRARIASGDLVRAQRLAQTLPSAAVRTLLLGRATVMSQPVSVIRSVEAVQPATPRIAVERHLVLATAHLRSSRRVARAHLQQAAHVAWHHGLALALFGAHAELVAMARATAAETQDDALQWLLDRACSGQASPATASAESPLSRGELHLLGLLPSRPRYSELADALGISVNTVKTRLRKLYAKLGAGSRDEAVAKARLRGLLPPD